MLQPTYAVATDRSRSLGVLSLVVECSGILIAVLVPHVLCVAPAVRHCGCYVCKCFPHDTNYFCQSHHLSFRRLLSCALRLAVQLANAARRAVVPLAIVKYLLRCNLDAVTAACLGVQRR